MRGDQLVRRLRAALAAAEVPRHTVEEILACGCEPDVQHCSHCDRLREANAKREEALLPLAAPDNVKALLVIIDRLSQKNPEIDWKLVALSVLTGWSGNDGAWIGPDLVPKEWQEEINREQQRFSKERGYW